MALIKGSDRGGAAREAVVLDLGDLRREADEMVARAEAEAARIVREAEEERVRLVMGAAEEGHERGLEEGRARGLELGRKEGREEAVKEWGERFAAMERRWLEAVGVFEGEREEMVASAREEVLRLALSVAERVTRRVVEVDPRVVAEQMRAVLERVMSPSRLRLVVHPEDLEVAREVLPGLVTRLDSHAHVALETSDGVARGSCVAHTGGGRVEADIEDQLARVVQALMPGHGAEDERAEDGRGGGSAGSVAA